MSHLKSRSRQAGTTASARASARPASPKPRKRGLPIPPILLEGDQPPESGQPVQKFTVSPAHPGPTSAEPGGLPESYGTGKLGIIARDPRCLYVFWDATRQQQESYLADSRQTELVLRIEDKTTGQQVSELRADLRSRSWFMRVPQGGVAYRANLGFADPARGWMSIAVSETVRTPSEGVSPQREARFAEVRAPQNVPDITARTASSGIGDFVVQSTPPEVEQAEFELGLPPAEVWSPAREQALQNLVHLDEIRREWIGSLEVAELVARAHLASELPIPEQAQGSISSPLGGQPPPPRQFWFNLNAELVVYGATEPNARVTLAGREVKLRPDGTFSYRFALPDGFFELPAAATSAEHETRSAILRFMRQTEYHAEVGAHPQPPELKPPP